MWALRRASATHRVHGLNLAAFRTCTVLGPYGSHAEDKSSNPEQPTCRLDGLLSSKRCNHVVQLPTRLSIGCPSFSSQAGAKSGGEEEDDVEDGFSELQTSGETATTLKEDVDDNSTSDSDENIEPTLKEDLDDYSTSDSDENVEDALETELMEDAEEESATKSSKKKREFSGLFKLIMNERGPSISVALDKYVADGKDIDRSEISQTLRNLRRRKFFGKALQLSEWVEAKKVIDFQERDYASRVDLIAKVRGLHKAESYIEKIPKSKRKEVVYRTLLANCIVANNIDARKAEEVFNKMKDLAFPLSVFSYNQLLILYKRTNKYKIADVLLMMEKENVKPTPSTYLVLIDAKGQSKDMDGMDQVVERMMAEGMKPNSRILATLAKHYAAAGLKEKAEELLKEIKGGDLQANRWMAPFLLSIYADLKKPKEVKRVWEACESKTRMEEYSSAIEAFGKLKDVEQAEEVFNKIKANKQLESRHFNTMLKVYVKTKMLTKVKELLKQMGSNRSLRFTGTTWDTVVKLYVDAGEVEKAESMLHKAAQQHSPRPLFSTYMLILDYYAWKGDIRNAEKMFHMMRLSGYVSHVSTYNRLLKAYIIAKAPAYGIRERLQADNINIIPNKALSQQLAVIDTF